MPGLNFPTARQFSTPNLNLGGITSGGGGGGIASTLASLGRGALGSAPATMAPLALLSLLGGIFGGPSNAETGIRREQKRGMIQQRQQQIEDLLQSQQARQRRASIDLLVGQAQGNLRDILRGVRGPAATIDQYRRS